MGKHTTGGGRRMASARSSAGRGTTLVQFNKKGDASNTVYARNGIRGVFSKGETGNPIIAVSLVGLNTKNARSLPALLRADAVNRSGQTYEIRNVAPGSPQSQILERTGFSAYNASGVENPTFVNYRVPSARFIR